MVSELFDHCDTVYRPSGGLRILMLDSLIQETAELCVYHELSLIKFAAKIIVRVFGNLIF